MAPPAVKANAVADAIVARLDLIRSAWNADLYHVQVKQVRRGAPVDILNVSPRPAYLVSVLGWQRAHRQSNYHGLTINVGIHILVDAPSNVEPVIVNAARDVEYQLQGSEKLGGLIQNFGDPTIELDHVKVSSSEMAYGLVTIPVYLKTDHTAP